jgi:hypothetical protein
MYINPQGFELWCASTARALQGPEGYMVDPIGQFPTIHNYHKLALSNRRLAILLVLVFPNKVRGGASPALMAAGHISPLRAAIYMHSSGTYQVHCFVPSSLS